MMNLPAEGKPQIQLICDRLIDRFAARLKEDSSLDIPLDTQEEFLRVKAERAKEREIETDLHREREIYSKYGGKAQLRGCGISLLYSPKRKAEFSACSPTARHVKRLMIARKDE